VAIEPVKVSLTGRVLPIGGREAEAARPRKAAGITTVLIRSKRARLDDVPASVREADRARGQ